MRRTLLLPGVLALAAVSPTGGCVGTTGSDLVTFRAYGRGPSDVHDHTLDLDTGRGYHVTLTKAFLHIGAIYLNRSRPISGAQATSCILPGIYVAQITTGIDIDVLVSDLQPFPLPGEATADRAVTGEVWLTGGDVNAQDDPTQILDLEGDATKDGETRHFTASFTIGKNRQLPPLDKAQPGTNPICKQRIATPIPIDLTPRNDGGALVLTIDPRLWFANVDFSQLKPSSSDPSTYAFTDSSDSAADAASRNLFQALHASVGVYSFAWTKP